MRKSKCWVRLIAAVAVLLGAVGAAPAAATAGTGTGVDHYHCSFQGIEAIQPDEAGTYTWAQTLNYGLGGYIGGEGDSLPGNFGVENAYTEALEQSFPGSEGSAGTEAPDDPAGSDNAEIDIGGDDGGSYTFSASATCAFAASGPSSNGGSDQGVTGVYCALIFSSGTYEDVVAGTGTQTGSATVDDFGWYDCPGATSGSGNTQAEGPLTVKYHMNITHGHGSIAGSSQVTADSGTVTGATNGEGEQGTVAGSVSMIANAGAGPCYPDQFAGLVVTSHCQPGVNQDVSQFAVNGAFTVVVPESQGS